MKKLFLGIYILAIGIMQVAPSAAIDYIDEDDSILNTELEQAVDYGDIEHGETNNWGTEWYSPLRDWTQKSVEDVGGILASDTDTKVNTYEEGQVKTLKMVRNIINYALGFLGLIALVYIMYHGFLVVTAGEDEEKYKEALKSLKTGFIAIWGIALSWFIVTFIFYVLSLVTDVNVLN